MAPHVLAVQNIKGGVGKTSVAVNLAATLAVRSAKKVLVIDADAQCNATAYLLKDDTTYASVIGTQAGRTTGNLYDLFHEDVKYIDLVTGKPHGPRNRPGKFIDKVRDCDGGGELHLLAASPQLFEIQEIAPEICVDRLPRWLAQKKSAFDLVVIDCPPSISSVSLGALKAADSVLVPMKADAFSVTGLPILLNSLKSNKKALGIRTPIAGVVITMHPSGRTAAGPDALATEIGKVCQVNNVKLLAQRISHDKEYPDSLVTREPIAFNTKPRCRALATELAALAGEIGLTTGDD